MLESEDENEIKRFKTSLVSLTLLVLLNNIVYDGLDMRPGWREQRTPTRLLTEIIHGRRRVDHPGLRWIDTVVADARILAVYNWTTAVQDRNFWRLLGEEA